MNTSIFANLKLVLPHSITPLKSDNFDWSLEAEGPKCRVLLNIGLEGYIKWDETLVRGLPEAEHCSHFEFSCLAELLRLMCQPGRLVFVLSFEKERDSLKHEYLGNFEVGLSQIRSISTVVFKDTEGAGGKLPKEQP